MSKSKHDKELQEALEKAIKKADKAAAKATKAAKKRRKQLKKPNVLNSASAKPQKKSTNSIN